MGISSLIVALALSNIQHDVVVQYPVFMNDSYVSKDVDGGLLVSNGNPWVLSVTDGLHLQDSGQQPPVQSNRPRCIAPQELKAQDVYHSNRCPLGL